jgi:hypothetical protein
MLFTWLQGPTSGKHSPSAPTRPRASRRAFRPALEALEPRWVPTAISVIQSIGKAAINTGGSSLAIHVATGVAAGHGVVVELAVSNGGSTFEAQVTDSAGNTYSHDEGAKSGTIESDMYSSTGIYAIPAGGQITVSFNSAVKTAAATAQEFYGLGANLAPDNMTSNSGSSFAPKGTITTFTRNDLVLAAFAVADGPSNHFTPMAGSLALPGAGVSAFNGSSAIDIDPAYTIAGSPGSHSVGVTLLRSAGWLGSVTAYTGDPTTHFQVTASASSAVVNNSFTLTVEALDASNHLDLGYTGRIHFTSSDNLAALPADYTFAPADNGVHTFSNVMLGTLNLQSIKATDTIDNTVSGRATVTATPPAGTHIVVSAPASTLVKTQFSITIIVVDASNNVLTGYAGPIHFTSSDSMATLPPAYSFTIGPGGDNGVHMFSGVILRTAGTDTITATSTAFSSVTGSTSVSALTALATTLSVTGFPSSTIAGVAHEFMVIPRDAFGNLARGFRGTVQFTSSDTQALLPLRYTFTAADQGMHIFEATFMTGGRHWLAVTYSANPSVGGRQSGIIVNGGAIAALSPGIVVRSSPSLESRLSRTTVPANGFAAGGNPWGTLLVADRGADSSAAPRGLNARRGGDFGGDKKVIADLTTAAVDELFANAQ